MKNTYLDGPQSDHRGLFADINPNTTLGQPLANQHLCPPNSQSLKSGNPELVEAYHKAMHKFYADHNTVEQIPKLFDIYTKLSQSQIKKSLEKRDCGQGRAMAQAMSIITMPRKPHSWSLELQNVGLICKYWRMRHREEKYHKDFTATFDRIKHLVNRTPSSGNSTGTMIFWQNTTLITTY